MRKNGHGPPNQGPINSLFFIGKEDNRGANNIGHTAGNANIGRQRGDPGAASSA